jgi:hypothetical protein
LGIYFKYDSQNNTVQNSYFNKSGDGIYFWSDTIRNPDNNLLKDIKIARQCLDFWGLGCDNKDCLNLTCPLNKEYDEELKSKQGDDG